MNWVLILITALTLAGCSKDASKKQVAASSAPAAPAEVRAAVA